MSRRDENYLFESYNLLNCKTVHMIWMIVGIQIQFYSISLEYMWCQSSHVNMSQTGRSKMSILLLIYIGWLGGCGVGIPILVIVVDEKNRNPQWRYAQGLSV